MNSEMGLIELSEFNGWWFHYTIDSVETVTKKFGDAY